MRFLGTNFIGLVFAPFLSKWRHKMSLNGPYDPGHGQERAFSSLVVEVTPILKAINVIIIGASLHLVFINNLYEQS